jgi:hypothetical protein
METLKIQLATIFILEDELSKLLNEKISLSTKYWLLDLNNQVLEIKTIIDSLRDILIKTYGVTNNDGNIIIPYYLDTEKEIINPKFEQFQQEYQALLIEEKELQYKPIPFSVLEKIETGESYTFILQHLIEKTIK